MFAQVLCAYTLDVIGKPRVSRLPPWLVECLYIVRIDCVIECVYLREAAVFLDKGGAVLPRVRHGAFAQREPLSQRLGGQHQVRRSEGHCPRQQTAVLFVLLHSRQSLWPFCRQQWNMCRKFTSNVQNNELWHQWIRFWFPLSYNFICTKDHRIFLGQLFSFNSF